MKSDGTVVLRFHYRYATVGNRTAMIEFDASRVTWPYDAQNQLLGEHRTGTNPYRQTYTYDPAGNRLLKNIDGARATYSYDQANQLQKADAAGGRTTYVFDAAGNQQVEIAPDLTRTTTVWDYENQPRLIRLPSGARVTYTYNAEFRRVKTEE